MPKPHKKGRKIKMRRKAAFPKAVIKAQKEGRITSTKFGKRKTTFRIRK